MSTYSNLENHPKLLDDIPRKSQRRAKRQAEKDAAVASDGSSRIVLSQKTGLPVGVVPHHHVRDSDNDEEDEEDEEGDRFVLVLPLALPRTSLKQFH